MNWIMKALVARYGPVVAKRLYDEYKKRKANGGKPKGHSGDNL